MLLGFWLFLICRNANCWSNNISSCSVGIALPDWYCITRLTVYNYCSNPLHIPHNPASHYHINVLRTQPLHYSSNLGVDYAWHFCNTMWCKMLLMCLYPLPHQGRVGMVEHYLISMHLSNWRWCLWTLRKCLECLCPWGWLLLELHTKNSYIPSLVWLV